MPENPVEALLRQVNACVAAIGFHLSQAPDIESAIPVLQDLSSLRARVQEIQDKHREFFEQLTEEPQQAPPAAEPVAAVEPEKLEKPEETERPEEIEEIEAEKIEEAPRGKPAVKAASSKKAPVSTQPVSTARGKKASSMAAASSARKRGRPTEAVEHTPLQMYRPFILRAMRQLKGGARYSDIQKKALELMKDAGVAKPQDEEPVGASGVIRYIAQSGAVKKQLLRDNLIHGSGPQGFSLTPEGEEELKKISA